MMTNDMSPKLWLRDVSIVLIMVYVGRGVSIVPPNTDVGGDIPLYMLMWWWVCCQCGGGCGFQCIQIIEYYILTIYPYLFH